jgi:hypothetical protein
LFGLESAQWVRSPNGLPQGSADASHARSHGAFDDDRATVLATLARILRARSADAPIELCTSAAALGDRRRMIAQRI